MRRCRCRFCNHGVFRLCLSGGKGAVNNIAKSVAFQQIHHIQRDARVFFQPVDDACGGNGVAPQIKKVVLSGKRAVITKTITHDFKQMMLVYHYCDRCAGWLARRGRGRTPLGLQALGSFVRQSI